MIKSFLLSAARLISFAVLTALFLQLFWSFQTVMLNSAYTRGDL